MQENGDNAWKKARHQQIESLFLFNVSVER